MRPEEFAKPLVIGGREFCPGEHGSVDLPIGRLITTEMNMTVHVRRGEKPGPRLLLTAAVHGDEINGVEVIRRVLRSRMKNLCGDLIAIPIVNVPALLGRSRYLPDRRDLNRLFPGSAKGSYGARLTRLLTQEFVDKCTHGIDLHTGAVNRPNLPQIRFCSDVPETKEMAEAFGAPVMMGSAIRPGSFRSVFHDQNKPQILYEGGEAEILEPTPVKIAIRGVFSVMQSLNMLPAHKLNRTSTTSAICYNSIWERAPKGGLFLPSVDLGAVVAKDQILGKVGSPSETKKVTVRAREEGVIIGRARNALVDEGDGLFHIGLTKNVDQVVDNLEAAEAELDHRLDHSVFDDPLVD